MPIRVRISYKNPKHYLISQMTMTMEADAAAVPQVKSGAIPSKPGAIRFDIPDGVKEVTLKILIPKQRASPVSILELTQHFKVAAGRPPRLNQLVFDGPPFMADGPKLYHPRLSEPATAGSGKGKLFELVLDTRFLRVTDFARRSGRLDTFAGTEWKPPMGSRVVVLEDTHPNPNPIVWYVLIPPAVDSTQSKINVLMFYRPEMIKEFNYKDLRDIEPSKFMRYSDDPPAGSPFFISAGTFSPYPPCAYERQLVQSGKRVVMAFPMPHVTNYGLAEGVTAPDTLRRFVKTLWMEGEVGGRADDKAVLGRVAVAGFSSGGDSALKAVGEFGNSIDELYLFDPGKSKGFELLKGWLAGKSDRKLRMIAGGYQQSTMQAMHVPDAMINSVDSDFWFTDLTYLKALSPPGGPIEKFDHLATAAASGTATTPATVATGLFRIVAPGAPVQSPIVLEGRFQTPKGAQSSQPHRIGGNTLPSEAEAASFAHFGGVPRPVKSDADVVAVANAIVNQGKPEPDRIRALRHSWASCGGKSADGTRTAADYKGYLQSCLEKSSF
jgi:hypothetical protein